MNQDNDVNMRTGPFEDDPSQKADVWYKLRSIGGISTAIVAALIGLLGSLFLHNQQESANKIQLYTQLMSEQEKAENDVRKDMFQTVLASFLDDEGTQDSVCAADRINQQLLELEMIARNFHETMDLKPLFLHVLLNIVREIPRNYKISTENDLNALNKCQQKFYFKLLQEKDFKDAGRTKKFECMKDHIKKWQRREKDKLSVIAKRITRKQLESLSDVEKRIRLTINLNQTCRDKSPLQLSGENDICSKPGVIRADITKVLNDDRNEKKRSKRTFTIFSNWSFPDWNLIHLKITTNRMDDEIAADPDGNGKHESEFWLGYFDFPLMDNTFLSSKERYAVILDEMDDQQAKISLIYFPASYAGFKEKSFYQHRIVNTLLTDNCLNR